MTHDHVAYMNKLRYNLQIARSNVEVAQIAVDVLMDAINKEKREQYERERKHNA